MTRIKVLREYANGSTCRELLEQVTDTKCSDYSYCSTCQVVFINAIVDQIERETERACRNLSSDGDVFVCSECRNETHGFMFDDFGCTVGFGLGVGRCPNCGAKVVRR